MGTSIFPGRWLFSARTEGAEPLNLRFAEWTEVKMHLET